MASFHNFPEEPLLHIFSYLVEPDINACQRVCRSWYIPGHVKFLETVSVRRNRDIERFIAAIDHNPNSRYLKAVKGIFAECYNWNVSNQVFQKLFFRFPNLEFVLINSGILSKFDDNICRKFIKHCPKLEQVAVNDQIALSPSTLLKARLLIIELDFVDTAVTDIVQFVTSFPRLKRFVSFSKLDSFEKFLAILQKLNNLTAISFKQVGCLPDDFADTYLASKKMEERIQLVERLSKVKELDLYDWVNTLENLQQWVRKRPGFRQFCLTLPMFIPSIDFCNFHLKIPHPILWDQLSSFTQRLFDQPSQTRVLQLQVWGIITFPDVTVLTNKHNSITHMTVQVPEYDLQQRGPLFDKDALFNMDEFSLVLKHHPHRTWINVYEEFFNCKSTVKEVTFHAPTTILGEKQPPTNIAGNHKNVEKLTILSRPDISITPLLTRCPVAFPNLKSLTFRRHCGKYHEDFAYYELKLGRFTLEKLAVDVGPLKKRVEEEGLQHEFFVLEFFVDPSRRPQMYKISLDLSLATRIDGLQGFDIHKDYFMIHVGIISLNELQFFSQRGDVKSDVTIRFQ